MATKKNNDMPQHYFLVKITLVNSRPKSWRNLCIPADLPADDFMDIILRLFGWSGSHLYDFEGYRSEVPNNPFLEGYEEKYADMTIKDLFVMLGPSLRFVYDYGDYHLHKVDLMNTNFTPESGQYPIYCIRSKGGHGIEDGECEDWDEDEYEQIFDEYGDIKDFDVFKQILEDCAKRVTPITANADIAGIVGRLYTRKLVYGDPCVVLSKADAAALKKAQKEQEKAQKAKEKAEQKALKAANKAKTATKKKTDKAVAKED